MSDQQRNKQQDEEPGHQAPQTSAVSEDSADPEIQAFQKHQATAARLTLAEEARTLVANAKFGVLSTIASSGNFAGHPGGSAVEFASDEAGRPVFSFSTLSPHTGDVRRDDRVCLTVLAEGFKSIQDARVSLTGTCVQLPEAEATAARAAYLAKHPDSYWVDFGDFSWHRLQVLQARVVGGFARAGRVGGEEYASVAPDPIAQFSAPVALHMSADHADATVAMIRHFAGITVDSATVLSVDRLGMNVSCSRQGQSFKARLPFPRPATDRKSIRELVVEMAQACPSSGGAGA